MKKEILKVSAMAMGTIMAVPMTIPTPVSAKEVSYAEVPSLEAGTTDAVKRSVSVATASGAVEAAGQQLENAQQLYDRSTENVIRTLDVRNETQRQMDEAENSAREILAKAKAKAKEEADNARAVLEETQNELEGAQKELEDKDRSYTEAIVEADTAEQYLEKAKEEATDVTEEDVEAAEVVANNAEEQFKRAEQEKDSAQKEKENAEATLKRAQDELEEAKAVVDNANVALETAKNNTKDAQDALKSAQNAYDNAVANNDTESEVYKAAVDDLNEKKALLTQAEEILVNAENTVAAAEQAYANAENVCAEAEDVLKEKQNVLTQKMNQLDAARDEAEQAEIGLNNANANVSGAKNAVIVAENNIAAAETAKADAEAKKNIAKQEKIVAENSVKEAQEKYEEAKIAAESADEQIALGSLGFFKYMDEKGYDSDIAVGWLTGDPVIVEDLAYSYLVTYEVYQEYMQKTKLGSEGDATSLEKMKESFQYIHKCNELRTAGDLENGFEPQEPLLVNSALMAIAQTNINASMSDLRTERRLKHQSKVSGIGENLAATYGDPFYMWYDQERERYMEEYPSISDYTGHYLNIIDPKRISVFVPGEGSNRQGYSITGFGINGSTGYSQVFSYWVKGKSPWYGESYSLEEYEGLFNEYYDNLMNASAEAGKCEAALQDAKSTLTEKETILIEMERELENAQNNLINAQKELSVMQEQLATAQEVQAEKQAVNTDKQEALGQAEEACTEAEKDVKTAENNLSTLKADEKKAAEKLEQANNAVVAEKEAVSKAYEEVMASEKALAALNEEVQSTLDILNQKKDAFNVAQVMEEAAKETYTNAENAYDAKNIAVVNAATSVEDKKQTLQITVNTYNEKKKIAEEEKKKAETLRGKLDTVKQAQYEFEKAKANVISAQEAHDLAVEKCEELENVLMEKTEILNNRLDLQERANALVYENVLANPIKDKDFSYLNPYFDTVRTSYEEMLQADKALEEALVEQENNKAVLDKMTQEYAAAVADLAIAQADAEKEAATYTQADAKAMEESTPENLEAKAPKTGDYRPIKCGFLLSAVSLLGLLTLVRKKKESK